MRSSLFDYEWQFLTQMITRIHYTASYEELCRLLLEDQLPTLIPFDRAVVFQTGRQNGQGTVAAPYTVGMPNDPKKNPFLDRAVIPRWSQFIMAPHSTVFLQSDLIAAEDWIHSDIYRNIWEPCRLYWALGATIQYRDRPLALVALFRERDKADFNPKEFHILHTLKDALERKFYDLLAEPAAGVLPAERLRQAAAGYGLTKRETEIAELVCRNLSTEEICEKAIPGARHPQQAPFQYLRQGKGHRAHSADGAADRHCEQGIKKRSREGRLLIRTS